MTFAAAGLFRRYAGLRHRHSGLWNCLTETSGIVVDIVLIGVAAGGIIADPSITYLH